MKNKFWIKALSLLMAVACVGLAACKKESKSTEKDTEVVRTSYQGTHVYTATETDKDFIKNGVCDYTLVLPETCSAYLRTAQNEFLHLFKMATGIDLKTTTDDKLAVKEHAPNTKYISLGETTLVKSTDIDYSLKTLDYDGGRIVTKDSNIYIVGGYDTGSLFAVYTFMRLTFNYECYYQSCIVIDRGVTNLKLKNYDVTDIPDFKKRIVGLGSGYSINFSEYDNVNFMYRMGYQNTYNQANFRMHQVLDDPNNEGKYIVNPSVYAISENSEDILSKETMGGTHPGWFSTQGLQWCYTARGDAADFDKMTDAVAESVKYALMTYTPEEYPLRRVCSITQEDNDNWCGCEACNAEFAKYKTQAGAIIKFMNVVCEKVEAWMLLPENAPYKRDNLQISINAYGGTETPPAQKNAKGEWEAIDSSVIPHKRIAISHANINVDYQQSIYAEDNTWARDKIDGWTAITDNISWYTYNTNRRGFMYFYDSFNHYTADGFQYYASKSDVGMYVESQTNNPTPSVWHNLKFYLVSKLQWDCTLDEDVLMENFFNAMYGPAAKLMREFFDAERMYCYNEFKAKNMFKKWSIYNYVNTDCDWSANALTAWLDKCDQALKAVETYKYADPVAYEQYCKHIEIEAISVIVMLFDQHEDNMSTTLKNQYLARLRADCARWDLSQMIVVHVAYGTPTMLPEWVELK